MSTRWWRGQVVPPPPRQWDDSLTGGGGRRCAGTKPTLAGASTARQGAGTSSPGRGTAPETPVPTVPQPWAVHALVKVSTSVGDLQVRPVRGCNRLLQAMPERCRISPQGLAALPMVRCWRLDPSPSPCPDDDEEDGAQSFLPLMLGQHDVSILPAPWC